MIVIATSCAVFGLMVSEDKTGVTYLNMKRGEMYSSQSPNGGITLHPWENWIYFRRNLIGRYDPPDEHVRLTAPVLNTDVFGMLLSRQG